MKLQRLVAHILLLCMLFSIVNIEFTAFAEDMGINVLNVANAELTITSSAGIIKSNKAFDRDFFTSESLSDYDGVKIYDCYGKNGSDYCALLNVDTTISLSIETIRLYVSPTQSSYLGKATYVYPVGVDVFSVDNNGNYEKIYSAESLENELKKEAWEKEYWSSQRRFFTYYDFNLDNVINTQKIVMGIKAVEPWLGSFSFKEICFYAPKNSISAEYKKIELTADNDSNVVLNGENQVSDFYFMPKTLVEGEVQPKSGYTVKSVKIADTVIECENNKFSFKMPDTDAELKIETVVEEILDVPLTVTSCGLMMK